MPTFTHLSVFETYLVLHPPGRTVTLMQLKLLLNQKRSEKSTSYQPHLAALTFCLFVLFCSGRQSVLFWPLLAVRLQAGKFGKGKHVNNLHSETQSTLLFRAMAKLWAALAKFLSFAETS